MGAAACAAPSGGEPRPERWGWLERVNRFFYAFNQGFDRFLLKPVATGYRAVMPDLVQTMVTNGIDNVLTIETVVNDVLQGKPGQAGQDTGRLLLNSTFGLGGLFDPASDVGLERHEEDFGQTLAVWGAPAGPYLVLPILGPSTVRDSLRWPALTLVNPLTWVDSAAASWTFRGVFMVDRRSVFYEAMEIRDESADPYVFTRETWLQRRRYQVAGEEDQELEQERSEELEDLLDELGDF